MGCTVSKSAVEPRTVTIKLSGCSNFPGSHSSPVQLPDARHAKTESDHVVSLTSSTYGSLRLDSLPSQGEERRTGSMGNVPTGHASGATEDVNKQVETINMWELMDGLEEEKAALAVLRGLMGNTQKVDSGERSPRVYHTLEDVDTVLDIRKSLAADYRVRRGSSMDSISTDKATGVYSPMVQMRRSRALQISREVIEELDDLKRKNLSRSLEFQFTGRKNLSQSQEFSTTSVSRRNLSQSQDLDSIRRVNLTSRRIGNHVSRSQEFVRPRQEGFPTRHSSETLRKDERRNIALSKPDVVLRSPMLRGKERVVSSNTDRRDKPLVQGQAQSGGERKTTVPRAAGTVSLNLSSPERRSRKVLEPRVASAVAALSRLGEQRAASMARPASERKVDQSSNSTKANYYSVSKIPAYSSVVTVAENTQLLVPQDHGRNISAGKKQSDRCGQTEQSAAMVSPTSEAFVQRNACGNSSPPQEMRSQGEPDDPISLDYELVTKAEVVEAVLRSGSSPVSNTTFSTKTNTLWSECRDSPPLDPELLASFEEAMEMFTADDWCTVRIGESDVDAAATSGSSASDAGSPSWLDHLDTSDAFEILENHVEKPQPKKLASSKVAPLEGIDPLEKFQKKCPPGGEARCVLYTTSLRGIRKTFEDCSHTRRILQYSNVQIDERDIAMHGEFRQEVTDLVGRTASVPRLFIRGRYIGGAEEVAQLFEDGTLGALLQDLPKQASHAACDGCGGVRFVPCATCCGSCKVVTPNGVVTCCDECNENGLCRCPLCL